MKGVMRYLGFVAVLAMSLSFALLSLAETEKAGAQPAAPNANSETKEKPAAAEAPPTSDDEAAFNLRLAAINRRAEAKLPEGRAAAFVEFEKGVRELQKEFPKREETWELLLIIASNSEPEKARSLAKELVENAPNDDIKDQAKGLLKKLEVFGKPLQIQFQAIDGREVSLEKLRGKVVLVDFWATWCGPCVREIPNVKAAYEKLHPKGFEIVGISFDQDKEALKMFVEKKQMPWPQYFDGKGWKNQFGVNFGISAIPSMWLVDKKGIVRDLNARENLAGKVEKFLAEAD